MSKPVRIRGDVAVRVEELAGSERRPFANMVEVLLLEALSGRNGAAVPGFAAVGPEYPDELEEAAALEERGSGAWQRSLRPRSSSAEPVGAGASVGGEDGSAAPESALATARPRTRMCEHRVPAGTWCKRCGS